MHNYTVGVVGLGYVGLPLAVALSTKFSVVGFDINKSRIAQLHSYQDKTREVSETDLQNSKASFTHDIHDLKNCNIFIITVPTPIDEFNTPDLNPLKSATLQLSKILKLNDIVVYESTVYPGATEEVCVPILEQGSQLRFNQDFFVGYSPERINPGDKSKHLTEIVKVVSGSTQDTLNTINFMYSSIITAGTHIAPSIRVAESAKVIENIQRDVNIALVNELAMLFNHLNIDTHEVLEAAGTKWNFLPFKPGLVGGHCIGVDPYYLTHKAISVGYHPEIILAGRKINDGMANYAANQLVHSMIQKGIQIKNSKILIMGLSFKEDCPDLRNTKVMDLYSSLKNFHADVEIFDPVCDPDEALELYGLKLLSEPQSSFYDSVVLAVKHSVFKNLSLQEVRSYCKPIHFIYDLKNTFNSIDVDGRL
ncbi:nucleotide sugar dehydrogenase [Gammaproteobacteria bacterium]|nr:nucleotide sugar dehydrogenase [Gammaproteobacteria bacterium]